MIGASTAYCSTLVNGLLGASYVNEDDYRRVTNVSSLRKCEALKQVILQEQRKDLQGATKSPFYEKFNIF